MDTFFILVIFSLTVPALIGLISETKFWHDQARTINDLSNKLHSTNTANMSNWLSRELGEEHPLIPALKRILATDHAPEASVDLIEPNNWYVRFLIGWRRYAIAVVLLCGIAGTLFSLHATIPANGNFAPHQLQTALANAFWPSIWGVIATLVLQLLRFAFLDPMQRKAELDFVALASNILIPWSLRHKNPSTAVSEATLKLQTVVNAFTNAANAGVAAITTGSEKANQSFERFDATVNNACKNLSNAFENSAKHISAVGTSSVLTIATSVQHAEQTITALGIALSPIIQRMEVVTINLKKAADRFDQSVAANGPFLTAMEQLYKASNPAEERYEKLLVAIMEMQKLSTTQNTILLQLHQETAKLTLSTIHTADESVQLAQTLQTNTANLPPALITFTKNSDALTTVAKQWQADINNLTAEFQKLLLELKTTSGIQQQLANDTLVKLPSMIADALATKLPQELAPLVSSVTLAGQNTSINKNISSLQIAIENLSMEMHHSNSKSSTGISASLSKKRKWYNFVG